MHYNENSSRKHATTADGKLRWAISYPKAFKGEKAVARPLKEKPTYGETSTVIFILAWLQMAILTLTLHCCHD